MDYRPSVASALDAFGLPVVVTRPAPNNTPITTRGVWMLPAAEDVGVGVDFSRRDPRRILVLPRVAAGSYAAVPEVERHTVIEAAEMDGLDTKTWKVDGYAGQAEPDHWRVYVREIE